jgi:hypothetical protein
VLFLGSTLHPFYQVYLGGFGGGTTSQLWSFKNVSQSFVGDVYIGEEPNRVQLWFFDYWFRSFSNLVNVGSSLSVFGISWVLPLLFTIQVLTVTFGVASVIFKKRILSFLPVLLTVTVILLAIYTNWVVSPTGEASNIPFGIGFIITLGEYQMGYYLAYPSMVLFVCAFALNEVVKKRQTASRDTSIPVKTPNIEI